MNLSSLPKPPFGKSSTRDIIVNILALQPGLTGKEIFNTINREFSKTVSYQGVHKELKALLENRVLRKDGYHYSIDPDWVGKINTYLKNLPTGSSASLKKELTETGFATRRYEKLMGMGRFCLREFLRLPTSGKKTVCFWYHIWPPIGFSDDEVNELRELFSKNEYIILSQFDTPMDLIGKNFFEGLGGKVLLGVPLSFEVDLVVHGDYVGQFFFDLDGKRNWDSLCRLNKKFEQINLVNFLKPISFLKFPIDIIVVKHPHLAEQLRRYAAVRPVKK